jgi:uncharacterized protein YjdB
MKKAKKLIAFFAMVMLGLFVFAFTSTTSVYAADNIVPYTVTITSAVSQSGTVPTGTIYVYASTYTSKCQLTKDHSMTLTLKGWHGYIITGITLSMKSNKSSGAGTLSVVAGSTTIASIEESTFISSNWHGSWSTEYVDVTPTKTKNDYSIKENEYVVITIAATANSLYCASFSITYVSDILPSSVNINKSSLNLTAGTSETLVATVLPTDTRFSNVTWSTSDDSVATVDSTGKLTAVAEGNATITDTSAYDSSLTAEYEVSVSAAITEVLDFGTLDLQDQLSFHYEYAHSFEPISSVSYDTTFYIGNIYDNFPCVVSDSNFSTSDLSSNSVVFTLILSSDDNQYFNINMGDYYLGNISKTNIAKETTITSGSEDNFLWTFDSTNGSFNNKITNRYFGYTDSTHSQIKAYAHQNLNTNLPATFIPTDGDVPYTDANGNENKVTMRIGYTISKEFYNSLQELGTTVTFGVRLNNSTSGACEAVEVDSNTYRICVSVNNIPLTSIETVITAVGYVSVDGHEYSTNEVNGYSVKSLAQEYLAIHSSEEAVQAASYDLTYLAYCA